MFLVNDAEYQGLQRNKIPNCQEDACGRRMKQGTETDIALHGRGAERSVPQDGQRLRHSHLATIYQVHTIIFLERVLDDSEGCDGLMPLRILY